MSNVLNVIVFALIALIVGSVLRFAYPNDMEWKADERTLRELALRYNSTGEYPSTGLASAAGIPNPPLSVVVFGLIARVTDTPRGMTQGVALLNVVALILFFLLFLAVFAGKERVIALWGFSIFCLSPLAILFARKLWAQDLLPFFIAIMMWAWTLRHKTAGGFLFGVLLALPGQVHMSGFFFCFVFLFWTLMRDRDERALHWKTSTAFILGGIVGALPMLPWLRVLLENFGHSARDYDELFKFRFFDNWLRLAASMRLDYSLGPHFWRDFLLYPSKFFPLTSLLQVFLGLALLRGLVDEWRSFRRKRNEGLKLKFVFYRLCLSYGVLLLFMGVRCQTHYLIVLFPWPFVYLAYVLRKRPRLMPLVCFANLALSLLFLFYIHERGGAPEGDYGVTYGQQGLPPN